MGKTKAFSSTHEHPTNPPTNHSVIAKNPVGKTTAKSSMPTTLPPRAAKSPTATPKPVAKPATSVATKVPPAAASKPAVTAKTTVAKPATSVATKVPPAAASKPAVAAKTTVTKPVAPVATKVPPAAAPKPVAKPVAPVAAKSITATNSKPAAFSSVAAKSTTAKSQPVAKLSTTSVANKPIVKAVPSETEATAIVAHLMQQTPSTPPISQFKSILNKSSSRQQPAQASHPISKATTKTTPLSSVTSHRKATSFDLPSSVSEEDETKQLENEDDMEIVSGLDEMDENADSHAQLALELEEENSDEDSQIVAEIDETEENEQIAADLATMDENINEENDTMTSEMDKTNENIDSNAETVSSAEPTEQSEENETSSEPTERNEIDELVTRMFSAFSAPVEEKSKKLTLGTLIRQGRKRHKITQNELAQEFGISQAMISCWENNLRTPNSHDLLRLAERLDIVQKLFPEYCKTSMIQQYPLICDKIKQLENLLNEVKNMMGMTDEENPPSSSHVEIPS